MVVAHPCIASLFSSAIKAFFNADFVHSSQKTHSFSHSCLWNSQGLTNLETDLGERQGANRKIK